MRHLFQSTKRLISICLVTLILITSTLTTFPATARADGFTSTSNGLAPECLPIDQEMLKHAKAPNKDIFENEDVQAIAAIAGASGATAGLGSVTVLTWTTTAHGIMALLGAGTTTVIALPVAGVVATSGLLAYGGYKVVKYLQDQDQDQNSTPCNRSLSRF